MFTLEIDEFVEEVRAEMAGYEEISEELIDNWVKQFESYVKKTGTKDKQIKVKGESTTINLDDEADLFKIVDKYLTAIESEETEAYWSDWRL